MELDNYFQHKEGCVLQERVHLHRVPIDCVTVDELWKVLDEKKEKIKSLTNENAHLKARIYDLEHEDHY